MLLSNYIYDIEFLLKGNKLKDETSNFLKEIEKINEDYICISFVERDSLLNIDKMYSVIKLFNNGIYRIISDIQYLDKNIEILKDYNCYYDFYLNISDVDLLNEKMQYILKIPNLILHIVLEDGYSLQECFNKLNKYANLYKEKYGKYFVLKFILKFKNVNIYIKELRGLVDSNSELFKSYIDILFNDIESFNSEDYYVNLHNWQSSKGVNSLCLDLDGNLYSFSNKKVIGTISDEFYSYYSNLMANDYCGKQLFECQKCNVLKCCRNVSICDIVGNNNNCDVIKEFYGFFINLRS